jgi:transcriptional antiterminator RfaH
VRVPTPSSPPAARCSPNIDTLRPVPILKREPDAFPDSIFEMRTPWWVAHLRSRQEKVLARFLREHDVPFYLPQMEKRTRRAGRTFTSYLPLFSGYLFFRGGREAKQEALKSNVIVNLLEPPDQAEFASELEQLHKLQLENVTLIPHPFISAGDTVMITEGAFEGYRGVVLKEKGVRRLVVSVSFIRQSVALDIDREFIRPQRRG